MFMKTLSKNDWLREGLAILSTEDFASITIDNLCKRLSITKGSFYHHFKNSEKYIEDLMIFWMEQNTLEPIRLTSLPTVTNKSERLHELARIVDHKAEQRIRAWSFSHPVVKEYVQKVDALRIEYLIDLSLLEGFEPIEARRLAMLDYSALVGFQQLFSDLPEAEVSDFWQFSTFCYQKRI